MYSVVSIVWVDVASAMICVTLNNVLKSHCFYSSFKVWTGSLGQPPNFEVGSLQFSIIQLSFYVFLAFFHLFHIFQQSLQIAI